MLNNAWLSTFCNFGAKLIALHSCESNTTWVMLSFTASLDRARFHWSTAEAITVCLHSWTWNHTAEELFSSQPCWRLSLSFQRFSFEMSLCCYIFTLSMWNCNHFDHTYSVSIINWDQAPSVRPYSLKLSHPTKTFRNHRFTSVNLGKAFHHHFISIVLYFYSLWNFTWGLSG